MPLKHPNGNRAHSDAGCLVPAVPARRAGKCLMAAGPCPQLPVPGGGVGMEQAGPGWLLRDTLGAHHRQRKHLLKVLRSLQLAVRKYPSLSQMTHVAAAGSKSEKPLRRFWLVVPRRAGGAARGSPRQPHAAREPVTAPSLTGATWALSTALA